MSSYGQSEHSQKGQGEAVLKRIGLETAYPAPLNPCGGLWWRQGQRPALWAGLRIAARVIVSEHNSGGIGQDGGLVHLARMDNRSRQAANRDRVDANEPVLPVKH
jgi:hypothetical protein